MQKIEKQHNQNEHEKKNDAHAKHEATPEIIQYKHANEHEGPKTSEAFISPSFHHANLYYLTMAVSLVLGIFFLVQGVRYHVNDELDFAFGFYAIAVMLSVVAKSAYTRGKGHYHYHGHLRD